MNVKPISLKLIDSIYKKNNSNKYEQNKLNNCKDKLEISSSAKFLSNLVSSDEEIDYKKVEEIKNKIKLGSYAIDSKEVAKKIIKEIKGE